MGSVVETTPRNENNVGSNTAWRWVILFLYLGTRTGCKAIAPRLFSIEIESLPMQFGQIKINPHSIRKKEKKIIISSPGLYSGATL